MIAKFKDVLKERLEENFRNTGIETFNSANSIQIGKALTQYYLKEIGQHVYGIYEDDIEDRMGDGNVRIGFIFR